MKLNLSEILLDPDGEPRKNVVVKLDKWGLNVTDSNGLPTLESRGDLTLSAALFASINGQYQGEQLPPEELYARGKLARKVKDKGEKNFSAEEVTKMMILIAKRYAGDPILVLTISEILDPEKFKPEAAGADNPA